MDMILSFAKAFSIEDVDLKWLMYDYESLDNFDYKVILF